MPNNQRLMTETDQGSQSYAYSFCSSIYNYLSKTKLTAGLYLMLLCLSPAAALTSNKQRLDGETNVDDWLDACSATLPMLNKGEISRFVFDQYGELTLFGCRAEDNDPELCRENKNSELEFSKSKIIDAGTIDKTRANYQKQFERENDRISKSAKAISSTLNSTDLKIFTTVMNQLLYFVGNEYSIKIAKKLNGVNCGEAAAIAVRKLIEQKLKTGKKVKIQVAVVYSNKPSRIPAHQFLILDSDLPSVALDKPKQTKRFLENWKKGKICDPWNNNYYIDINEDRTNFYKKHWDAIEITSVELDFDLIARLPPQAAEFIYMTLSQYGLPVMAQTSAPVEDYNTDERLSDVKRKIL